MKADRFPRTSIRCTLVMLVSALEWSLTSNKAEARLPMLESGLLGFSRAKQRPSREKLQGTLSIPPVTRVVVLRTISFSKMECQ